MPYFAKIPMSCATQTGMCTRLGGVVGMANPTGFSFGCAAPGPAVAARRPTAANTQTDRTTPLPITHLPVALMTSSTWSSWSSWSAHRLRVFLLSGSYSYSLRPGRLGRLSRPGRRSFVLFLPRDIQPGGDPALQVPQHAGQHHPHDHQHDDRHEQPVHT